MADTVSFLDSQGDNIGKMQMKKIVHEASNDLKQIREDCSKSVADIIEDIDNLVTNSKECVDQGGAEKEPDQIDEALDDEEDILLLHQKDSPTNNLDSAGKLNHSDVMLNPVNTTVSPETHTNPVSQKHTSLPCPSATQSESAASDAQSKNSIPPATSTPNDKLINDTGENSNLADSDVKEATCAEASNLKSSSNGKCKLPLTQGDESINLSHGQKLLPEDRIEVEEKTQVSEKTKNNKTLDDQNLLISDGEVKASNSKLDEVNTKSSSSFSEGNSVVVSISSDAAVKDLPESGVEEADMCDIQIGESMTIDKDSDEYIGSESDLTNNKKGEIESVEEIHSEEQSLQQKDRNELGQITLDDNSSGEKTSFSSELNSDVVMFRKDEQSNSVEAMNVDSEDIKVEQDNNKNISLSEISLSKDSPKPDTDEVSQAMEIDGNDHEQVSPLKDEVLQNNGTGSAFSASPSVFESKGDSDTILNSELGTKPEDNTVLIELDSPKAAGQNSISESRPDDKLEKEIAELRVGSVILDDSDDISDCNKVKVPKEVEDTVDTETKSENKTVGNNTVNICSDSALSCEIKTNSTAASLQKDTKTVVSESEKGSDSAKCNMKENGTEFDDEIIILDENEKSVPEKSEKISFKNILQVSKNCNNKSSGATTSKVENESEPSDLKETDVDKNSVSDIKHALGASQETDEIKSDSVTTIEGLNTKKVSEDENCGSPSKAQNERKRSLSTEEINVAKRMKLGDGENKQKSSSGEAADDPSMEVLDSDDDLVLAEDTAVTKSDDNKASDDKKSSELKADGAPILLSSEALQCFITARVKAFMKSQKQANLEKLNRRTRTMQSGSSLWKETAQHLEKTVRDLTVLNQKLEKRKAHANAVKNLSNRTIGIQVSEEKVKSVTAVVNENQKRNANGHPVATLSLPPSILLNPPPPQPPVRSPQVPMNASNRPPVRHQAVPTRPPAHRPGGHGRQIVGQGMRPNMAPQLAQRLQRVNNVQQQRAVQQTTSRTPTAPPPSNLIDLTDEEDTAKNPSKIASRPSHQAPPIGRPPVGAKNSGTANGFVPAFVMGSNSQMRTPLPGSQLISSGSPAVGIPASQLQLVSLNNPVNASPGAVFALVPGARPGVPANVPMAQGQPNLATVTNRVIPQNPSQTVTSATPPSVPKTTTHSLPPSFHISHKHPAPLPPVTDTGVAPQGAKKRPPKPGLKISRVSQGIVLSWNMPSLLNVESITSYQLFAYQETESAPPRSSLWKKVGDVKALPLPMACTLTQFQEGNKYHFAVRAVDRFGRFGMYSDPSSIFLGPKI